MISCDNVGECVGIVVPLHGLCHSDDRREEESRIHQVSATEILRFALDDRYEFNKINIMDLPQDPMMLFSVINMKLRDFYPSLDELCEDMNVDKQELIAKLTAFGFEYSEEHNKFW